LRRAALRQLVFDANDRRNTLKERSAFVGHRLRTFLTGHITPLAATMATGRITGFVEDRRDLTVEVMDEAMREAYREYKESGPERSGVLPDFLHEQFEHYLLCGRCREMVQQRIISDWELGKSTKGLIAFLRENDPEGLEQLRRGTIDKYTKHH
jgi:hypothetical protein